jgi:hypothetical protein
LTTIEPPNSETVGQIHATIRKGNRKERVVRMSKSTNSTLSQNASESAADSLAAANSQLTVAHKESNDQYRSDNQTISYIPHPFDSFKFVKSLEQSGFQHRQAVAIMTAIRTLIIQRNEISKMQTLSRSNLESELYLFRAAMSELRNEIQTLRRNETAAFKQELGILQREFEALETQMREDLGNMRNDVTMEVDTRKAASRADGKALDIKIHEMNNKLTKRLGDLRTEVEAHKWRLTRTMVSTVITAVVVIIVLSTVREQRQKEKESKATQTEQISTGTGTGYETDVKRRVGGEGAFVSLG